MFPLYRATSIHTHVIRRAIDMKKRKVGNSVSSRVGHGYDILVMCAIKFKAVFIMMLHTALPLVVLPMGLMLEEPKITGKLFWGPGIACGQTSSYSPQR